MNKTTVLITDDSLTMRAMIKTILARDPEIEVVGEAADPYEAREKIKQLDPDVLLLDIEMPKMSGLEFLKKIMQLRPMPVIMLSSRTTAGATDTIEALQTGAFECMEKPSGGDLYKALAHLTTTVKAAAKSSSKIRQKKDKPLSNVQRNSAYRSDSSVIGIGSSTGGVEALLEVLGHFHENCPPTLITQHMPETFLATFATRLNNKILPTVSLAKQDAPLEKGHVYLAPGGETHLQVVGRTQLRCNILEGPPVSGHTPSVDVMFESMAKSVGRRAKGVILTGMGRDGAQGLLEMRNAGAKTVGQNEASCIVYGMPRVAHEIGASEIELPLDEIGAHLMNITQKTLSRTG